MKRSEYIPAVFFLIACIGIVIFDIYAYREREHYFKLAVASAVNTQTPNKTMVKTRLSNPVILCRWDVEGGGWDFEPCPTGFQYGGKP